MHKFPKFQSATRHLQVGNGALVPALFVIPLVFKIQDHIFEVYTLVSEIQDKMDLILGVKNIFELEGIVNTRICSVEFLNRSLPIFPVAHHKIKPGRMAYVKVRIPFVEKLSGIAIVKLDRYHVPKFLTQVQPFNIFSGFRILASPKVLQGAFGDCTCPTWCSKPCPMLANRHPTGITWFPIVLYYIK